MHQILLFWEFLFRHLRPETFFKNCAIENFSLPGASASNPHRQDVWSLIDNVNIMLSICLFLHILLCNIFYGACVYMKEWPKKSNSTNIYPMMHHRDIILLLWLSKMFDLITWTSCLNYFFIRLIILSIQPPINSVNSSYITDWCTARHLACGRLLALLLCTTCWSLWRRKIISNIFSEASLWNDWSLMIHFCRLPVLRGFQIEH